MSLQRVNFRKEKWKRVILVCIVTKKDIQSEKCKKIEKQKGELC